MPGPRHPRPRPKTAGPRIATIALAITLLAAAIGAFPPMEPPAAQADPQDSIRVDVDSLTPAAPARDGGITITGTLTNISDSPIANVRAYLWRNQSPITNRTILDPILAGDSLPTGERVFVDGAFQKLTENRRPMQPRERLKFAVKAKIDDLDLPRRGGAYLVGVDVLGQVDNGATSVPGGTRLLLPLPAATGPDLPETKTKITSIVLLTSRPAEYAPGRFADDHLTEELSRGGRLDELLRAAAQPGMSWAIDPALAEELQTMADGYRVRGEDGNLTPGEGGSLAKRWLTDLAALDSAAGFRLPYATLDVTAAARDERTALIDQAAALGRESALKDLPELGWAGSGEVQATTVAAMTPLAPTAILTANADSAHRLLAKPPGAPAPLVRYDARAYAGGPTTDGNRTSQTHRRQRLLAEALVDAMSQPGGGGTVRVITDTVAAKAETEATAPWIERLGLTDLLGTEPQEWGQLFLEPTGEPISTEQLDEAMDLRGQLESYADAQANPAPARAGATEMQSRGASAAWRNRPREFAAYRAGVQAQLDDFFGGAALRLAASPRVTMSNQQAPFPVTVTNDLPDAVRVSIVFRSDNAARLSIPPANNVDVPPGESVTVNMQPRAAGNGTVGVQGQLTTPDGVPIGPGVPIDIEATQLGAVGWVIVAISGVVLVASTLFRIGQVRRYGRGPRGRPSPAGAGP